MAGLVALNLFYLAAGIGVVLACRSVLDRRDFVRLLPLCYMVGVAAVGLSFVQLSIVGIGPSRGVVLLVAAALAVAGGTLGARRGHLAGLTVAGERARDPSAVVGVATAAAAAVVLAALLQYGWIKPLTAWDAWAVWVPKAMAIHFGGGVTVEYFAGLQAPTYPLFVPVLQAAAFEWIGETATSALHVQYAVFAAGFVLAVSSLLRPFVPLVLVWPFLLLLLVLPATGQQVLRPEADFPLHYLFVLAALSLAFWILRREPWLLILATLFLAAGVTTKREGMLYIAALGLAALAVTVRKARERWPALIAACILAGSAAIPWHVWLRRHQIEAESSPQIGGGGGIVADIVDEPDRIVPALQHVVEALFSYDLWLIAPTFGIVAVGAGIAFMRDRRVPLFVLIASVIATAGFTWRILWGAETPGAFEDGALPTVRNVAALVLLWCSFSPLILAAIASQFRDEYAKPRPSRRLDALAGVPPIVAVLPALLLVVVGVGRGDFAWVRCEQMPAGDGPVHVVFETTSTVQEAEAIRDHIVALGFVGTTIGYDACGRTRVVLEAIEDARVGREIIEEARPAGLNPRLVEP